MSREYINYASHIPSVEINSWESCTAELVHGCRLGSRTDTSSSQNTTYKESALGHRCWPDTSCD